MDMVLSLSCYGSLLVRSGGGEADGRVRGGALQELAGEVGQLLGVEGGDRAGGSGVTAWR
nr:hypothetical protein [Streptomyces sp. ID05-04B]